MATPSLARAWIGPLSMAVTFAPSAAILRTTSSVSACAVLRVFCTASTAQSVTSFCMSAGSDVKAFSLMVMWADDIKWSVRMTFGAASWNLAE